MFFTKGNKKIAVTWLSWPRKKIPRDTMGHSLTHAAQQRAWTGNNDGSGCPQCGGTHAMALWTQRISLKPKCYISKGVGAPYLWVGLLSAWGFIFFFLKGKKTEMGKNPVGRR